MTRRSALSTRHSALTPQAVSAAKPRQSATAAGSLPASLPSTRSLGPGADTLLLTPCEPPAERTFGRFGDRAGLDEAIAAAKAGDVKRADDYEIWWLNTWGPRPDAESLFGERQDRGGGEVMAMQIVHGAGPRGETLIEWGLVDPCPRCWRRISMRGRCQCGGSGHVSGDWLIAYTDFDGNEMDLP